MDADELVEWMAVYRLEPWGEAAAWSRHARLMHLIYGLASMWMENPPSKSVSDFLPDN